MKKLFGLMEIKTSGLSLYCRTNIDEKSKAVILVLHGMMEHSARYSLLEKELKKAGFGFAAIDLPGHGKSVNSNLKHGDWIQNGFDKCAEEINGLVSEIKKTYELPVVLLGHSMGSFLALGTIEKFGNNIDACILSGSNWKQSTMLVSSGKLIASIIMGIKGENYKSQFMHKMAFGSYNKKIEPIRTSNDWLTTDSDEVDKYNTDPLCGFHCSALLYKNLSNWLSKIYLNYQLTQIPKNLPIFIFSGKEDPVGNYGSGPVILAEKIKETGVNKVKCKIYDNMRHECLNEKDKHEVINDVVTFCNEIFGGSS